jgi:hypothetical protein
MAIYGYTYVQSRVSKVAIWVESRRWTFEIKAEARWKRIDEYVTAGAVTNVLSRSPCGDVAQRRRG